MSGVEHFAPWRQQPQRPVKLAERWAGRVSFASIGGSTRNIAAAGEDTRNFDFETVASPAGLAVDPTTTAGRHIVAPPTGTQDFTILSVIVPQSVTGLQQIASRDNSFAGGAARVFQFRTNGAAVDFIRFNTSVSAFSASISGAAVIGRAMAVVGVSRGAAVRVFCNGASGSATLTGTPQTWAAATASDSRWFERRSDADLEHGSHLSALRVIIPEGISDDEALALSLNPWQLVAPRRIWVPKSAASGGVTAPGATLRAAARFAGGTATAGVTAPSATLRAAARFAGGGATAGGSITASGAALRAAARFSGGGASTTASATAPGAAWRSVARFRGGGAFIPGLGGARTHRINLRIGLGL